MRMHPRAGGHLTPRRSGWPGVRAGRPCGRSHRPKTAAPRRAAAPAQAPSCRLLIRRRAGCVRACVPACLQLPSWQAHLLQAAVELRTRLFLLPFGDQALFVRREVMQQLGGFHEHGLMEDVDLVKRLNRWAAAARSPEHPGSQPGTGGRQAPPSSVRRALRAALRATCRRPPRHPRGGWHAFRVCLGRRWHATCGAVCPAAPQAVTPRHCGCPGQHVRPAVAAAGVCADHADEPGASGGLGAGHAPTAAGQLVLPRGQGGGAASLGGGRRRDGGEAHPGPRSPALALPAAAGFALGLPWSCKERGEADHPVHARLPGTLAPSGQRQAGARPAPRQRQKGPPACQSLLKHPLLDLESTPTRQQTQHPR
jgi:hypothetical protein